MKRKLFFKLSFCYLLVAISMFALLNTYGVNKLKNDLINTKKAVLYNEAQLISSEYMMSFYINNMTLYNLSTQLKTIDTFLDSRIWIVSKQGVLLSDTRNPDTSKKYIDINEIDPTFLDSSISEKDSLEGLFHKPMLTVVLPVTLNYEIRGYIVMLYSMDLIEKEAINYIDIINICYLIFLVIMLFVFIYIYTITVLPLKKIIKAAKEYSSSNYDYPLVIKTTDEYRELSDTLTFMAGELNNLDDYQKKFVANISHDFRSPLTSIKGFTEAILDGTIPIEMQEKYLGIILFETERLSKLTNNLLSLNRFENNGTILDIVSFDINHIIKKTAESFERICRDKKITFSLIFSDIETFVDADMGKIQQVLYNLIDNAIKFSHSGSNIKISTKEKNDKIFISVKDYGIGIPKDSINKIWERFYKTDASRGKDKKGTGLGLSITKEILQAHNENINVISTEGVGTEFVFSLPLSVNK